MVIFHSYVSLPEGKTNVIPILTLSRFYFWHSRIRNRKPEVLIAHGCSWHLRDRSLMTKQNRLPLALRLFASPPGDGQLSLWNPLIFTCFLSDPDFTQKVKAMCECLSGLLFCGFMWFYPMQKNKCTYWSYCKLDWIVYTIPKYIPKLGYKLDWIVYTIPNWVTQ